MKEKSNILMEEVDAYEMESEKFDNTQLEKEVEMKAITTSLVN